MSARRPATTAATAVATLATLAALAALAAPAFAQRPPGGGPRGSGPPRGAGPAQPAAGDDDDAAPRAPGRAEPQAQAPQDPTAIPEELKDRIGTDHDGGEPSPMGSLKRSFFPVYEESKGDYRFRFLPPFYLEHTRGLPAAGAPHPRALLPTPKLSLESAEDTESLLGLVYYRRRSPRHDADVVFPLAWHVRDDASRTFVLGPLAHREAPGEHDNWIAPLAFTGARADGGYFHFPLLLTSSHWNAKSAFTLVGPYFRDRTGTDVDLGVAPLFFRGDNGDVEGGRKTYTLIPPLLYYHREREAEESSFTVVGPVITHENPKRFVFDVAPLFFSIRGKPESGGVKESHTTLFPFFHYGTSPTGTLFAVPGYLHRTTPTVDTTVTPLFVHSTTRSGATSLTTAGPILPMYYAYDDRDTGFTARGLFPFYYGDHGNEGRSLWTPLFARFERYGESRTFWAFPNLTVQRGYKGWETDLHPIVYLGREGKSSHTVLAPILWDFASPESRSTVAFPLFWRFAEAKNAQITQVAGNTVYLQHKVSGGLDWQFHFAPLFSYGENPAGYFWNVMFGLAGYKRQGAATQMKAFWIPIPLSGAPAPAPAPGAAK
ncbi:MAG: hypothetical protein IPQ09_05490 [Myxococcales bacterium]|nr:hypothetical protein [Myxococcales bacterium]HQY65500.1 hypothetical protein [Polyangiaceae bacterium]